MRPPGQLPKPRGHDWFHFAQTLKKMSKRIDIHDLTVTYGEIVAVTGLTMRVEEGEVVALLGANGAGKSSTLKAIIGTVRPAHGRSASTVTT